MNVRQYLNSFHDRLQIVRTMEVRREEYLDYVTFQRNDRPMFTEIFGPLLGLKESWAKEGATPEEIDMSAFRYRRPMWGHVPVRTGWVGGSEPVLLEENDDHILFRDERGREMKLSLKASTLPLPMTHPVKNMDDWLKIKRHYQFSESRFGDNWAEIVRQHRASGRVVTFSIPGGYDEPRQLMGDELICLAYYEQPELVHDMLNTMADTAIKVFERVLDEVEVDELFVHEDMAGRNGPLVGPRQVKKFIAPYYRRVWDYVSERGVRVFRQDSDGDMRKVIPAFLEGGVNFMYPIEPMANMDLVKLREEYGTRLAFMGGLDKHVLREGETAIEAELEYKIPPMVRTGGCILGLDHRIPNGTPLEAYRFYIRKAWEILEREAAKLPQ